VVRQQRVADPGHQGTGREVGVVARGLQGAAQEGFDLGSGWGVAFEEVAAFGHEGRAGRRSRRQGRELGIGGIFRDCSNKVVDNSLF